MKDVGDIEINFSEKTDETESLGLAIDLAISQWCNNKQMAYNDIFINFGGK